MGAWVGSETFWLDLTNIALGVVTLVCLLVIASGVVQELLPRLRRRAVGDDAHVMLTPDLGLTMADGGRPIAKKRKLFSRERRPR
jgi:hypothetical protein